MSPLHGSDPVAPREVPTSKSIDDSTKPSKSALPRALSIRVDAAKKDLSLSFGSIGDLIKSPFIFLMKPDNKVEMVENIFWGLVLPATLPAVLVGAALMLPLSLISGAVSFVLADTSQNLATGDYDSNPIQHYEDPNPPEMDEISTTDPLNFNPLNPEEKA